MVSIDIVKAGAAVCRVGPTQNAPNLAGPRSSCGG